MEHFGHGFCLGEGNSMSSHSAELLIDANELIFPVQLLFLNVKVNCDSIPGF